MVPLLIGAGAAAITLRNIWLAGAWAAADKRKKLLKDASTAIAKLGTHDELSRMQAEGLEEDVKLLRVNAAVGWKEPPEISALARIRLFLMGAHIAETAQSIWNIADAGVGALTDIARKPFDRPKTDTERHS